MVCTMIMGSYSDFGNLLFCFVFVGENVYRYVCVCVCVCSISAKEKLEERWDGGTDYIQEL